MSLFTIFSGRPTKDPVMQQAKNSATEYISLDIAVPRRKEMEKMTLYSFTVILTRL